MKFVTRFAPSPTGFLHIGNLRTAIFNYVMSKRTGGQFILRLDDTDAERSTKEFSDQIKRDLEWLGFEWDRFEIQSDRISLYEAAADRLRLKDCLYECFETSEELELKRRRQLSSGRPPVYDRSALGLTSVEKKRLRNERQSYWRFKLDQQRIDWHDSILGPISIDAGSVSDPVLIRGDGQFLYTLASVVDDIDFNINYVIRGSDHVTNTAVQIQLIKKMGAIPPSFAHHSLLVGEKGEPLSKRRNNVSLGQLRKIGLEPEAIFIFMASLGSQISYDADVSIREVYEKFNLSLFGSAPTKFNSDSLTTFSQKRLMKITLSEIDNELNDLKIPDHLKSDFWDMARENIIRRSDLEQLWKLCREGADPVILAEDKNFISVCKKLMPKEPRDQNSWEDWTNLIKYETKRSGKSLFLPLRKALTGSDTGPDMRKLFPLIQKIRF